MPNVLRDSWKANRHWLAAGFLISTALFLLLMYITVRGSFRGIAESKATGLAAIAGSPASFFFPELRQWAIQEGRSPRFLETTYYQKSSDQDSEADRLVIRTAKLSIVTADPLDTARDLAKLATDSSGFVVNSTIKGDQSYRAAEIILRIPASRFDDTRAQVRRLSRWVEEDSVQARDVTREAIDQDATLRNARAEEAQYLTILKRAATVKDIMEITEKLANVRARIDRQTAELRYLRQQVEMSQLTISVAAVPPTDKPGVHWRPAVAAKISLTNALESLGDFADAVVSLVLHLPVVAAWALLVFAIVKVGWWTLVRLGRLFFPTLALWRRRTEPVQAG